MSYTSRITVDLQSVVFEIDRRHGIFRIYAVMPDKSIRLISSGDDEYRAYDEVQTFLTEFPGVVS